MGCQNSKSPKCKQKTLSISKYKLSHNENSEEGGSPFPRAPSPTFQKAIRLGELRAQQFNKKDQDFCLEHYEEEIDEQKQETYFQQMMNDNKTQAYTYDCPSSANNVNTQENQNSNNCQQPETRAKNRTMIMNISIAKQGDLSKFNNRSQQKQGKSSTGGSHKTISQNLKNLNKFLEEECGFSPKRGGVPHTREKSLTVDHRRFQKAKSPKNNREKVIKSDFTIKPKQIQCQN